MWLLEFLFFAATLLIGWMLFGYILVTAFRGLFHRKAAPQFPAEWPFMSVIVPCYNEGRNILDKLDDLRALDYPSDRIEVVFADGGSADGSPDMLQAAVNPGEPYRVERCPAKGKINQLNHVLPQLRGDIVVNTDADARLAPDALRWIAAEFASADDVWVVGAYSRPVNTIDVENYYWDAQNKARFLESDAGASSIVIAQCYAFRRGLMTSFPDDVVADDIYVAFLAGTLGRRTIYSRHAKALETRGPRTVAEFLPHKFRKSNAFLRESLRFLYRLPEMGNFFKLLFVTRIVQQLLLPWAALSWLLLAGVMLTLFRVDIVFFGVLTLIILLLMTSRVFAWVKLPDQQKPYSITTIIQGYILTNIIMFATAVTYPFFSQQSSYARLGEDASKKEPDLK